MLQMQGAAFAGGLCDRGLNGCPCIVCHGLQRCSQAAGAERVRGEAKDPAVLR